MLKVLIIVLPTAMAATFAMDNMHHVGLGLIVGEPVFVRLFFLLLTSFLVGCFTTMLVNLYFSVRAREREEAPQDGEDDAFFSE